MRNAYDDFHQILSTLEQTLDDLGTSLGASLHEWDGEAREAFDVAHRKWRQDAEDMARQLGKLHRAIGAADDNYARCEAANLRMFSKGRR